MDTPTSTTTAPGVMPFNGVYGIIVGLFCLMVYPCAFAIYGAWKAIEATYYNVYNREPGKWQLLKPVEPANLLTIDRPEECKELLAGVPGFGEPTVKAIHDDLDTILKLAGAEDTLGLFPGDSIPGKLDQIRIALLNTRKVNESGFTGLIHDELDELLELSAPNRLNNIRWKLEQIRVKWKALKSLEAAATLTQAQL